MFSIVFEATMCNKLTLNQRDLWTTWLQPLRVEGSTGHALLMTRLGPVLVHLLNHEREWLGLDFLTCSYVFLVLWILGSIIWISNNCIVFQVFSLKWNPIETSLHGPGLKNPKVLDEYWRTTCSDQNKGRCAPLGPWSSKRLRLHCMGSSDRAYGSNPVLHLQVL